MSLPSVDDLKKMDYVYYGRPIVIVNAKDTIDSKTMDYAYYGLPIVAAAGTGATIVSVTIEELITATDEHLLTVGLLPEELIVGLDEIVISPVMIDELVTALDEVLITINVLIEELITATDEHSVSTSSSSSTTFDQSSGVRIVIGETMQEDDGSKIIIGEYKLNDASTKIAIGEDTLVLATNASSPSNPFEPTVAVGGNILIANPSTNPGSTALQRTSVYLHWLSAGISGNNWTDLFNFNFELDYSGGHFSVLSKKPLKTVGANPRVVTFAQSYHWPTAQGAYVRVSPVDSLAMANLGQEVDIFSFKGTILDFGPTISDSQAGWSTAGFFGAPLLNRNMNLLTNGTRVGRAIASTERLVKTTGNSEKQDIQSMAQTIASQCGVTLRWYTQDAPLQNTFKVDGMTGYSALATLASMVGGTLRWNGYNTYYVAYPNQSFGLWEVPHPKLLTSAGLNYSQHLDLESGATGNRLIMFPRTPITDSSTRNLPGEKSSGTPTIQQVGKMSKRLTDEDPPVIFDLPYDADKVYIQILVPETGSTGGGNLLGIQNYITKDPTQWFEFGGATLTGTSVRGLTEYVFFTNIGGVYVPQVKVDYRVFPQEGANDGIDEGRFVLSLACSTKSLNDVYDQGRQKAEQDAREALAGGFDANRYIKTYSGTITCQFFGSIPLPGMWGRAVVPNGATVYTRKADGTYEQNRIPLSGDMVVEGIIEHVQFSFPGIITVQVAQYAKIDFGRGRAMDINIGSFSNGS